MGPIEITDQKFSKKNSIKYNLSILIGLDRFFYLIADAESNALFLKQVNLLSGEDRYKSLQNAIISEKNLQAVFQNVRICYTSKFFTFIPDDLMDYKETRAYLEQVCHLPDQLLAFREPVNALKLFNVYGVNDNDFHLINSYFPKAQQSHLMSALSKAYADLSKDKKGDQLFVNVQSSEMAMFLFRNGSLVFNNYFQFKDAKDFLYYVLLVFEQLSLNQEETHLFISGKILRKSQIYELLSMYVRNLDLIPIPEYYNLNQEFLDVDTHYFFDLFSMKLCES